ncbi:MAG: hypothetical protein M1570_05940 [Chloroflexi bacterium]|nr:hypothetical protein [Chloroflexota bacterium]
MVSSDQQLAGTVTAANTSTGTAYASDAYSAVTNPSTSVILPIIMSHLGVWNTAIYVQNAGSANTNVTVHYVGSGAPADTTITNLPPNMTAVVDQASLSTTGFNGSAVVSGAQNLAVIVEEYKTTGGVLVAYNGLASSDAGQTVYMPGYIATGVWATDFTVVNTTGSLANVTVKFSGFSGQLNGSIPANGSAYINPRAGVIPSGWSGTSPTSGYYGAATVTSSQNVVVVYNISNSFGGPGNSAIGYTGFSSSKAALTKVVPLIENMYSTGWVTTFSVQSVDGTPANLTLTYSPAKGSCNGSCTKTYNMTSTDAGAHTFNQASDGHISAGFLGGVTITSNKNIVVIADQNNATASQYQGGDAAAGFAGF